MKKAIRAIIYKMGIDHPASLEESAIHLRPTIAIILKRTRSLTLRVFSNPIRHEY
jgi:hypothetical protein